MTASTATVKDRSTGTRKVLAAILAFALVSVFVIRTSNAAFTDTTTNPGNLFRTASISLDTDETMPLFGEDGVAHVTATGLVPGAVIEGCLDVDFTDETESISSADLAPVELEVALPETYSAVLADALDVTVQVESGGCGGEALGDPLNASLADFGDRSTAWTPNPDENGEDTVGYRFTVEVDPNAGNELQGLSVTGVNLVWSVSTN